MDSPFRVATSQQRTTQRFGRRRKPLGGPRPSRTHSIEDRKNSAAFDALCSTIQSDDSDETVQPNPVPKVRSSDTRRAHDGQRAHAATLFGRILQQPAFMAGDAEEDSLEVHSDTGLNAYRRHHVDEEVMDSFVSSDAYSATGQDRARPRRHMMSLDELEHRAAHTSKPWVSDNVSDNGSDNGEHTHNSSHKHSGSSGDEMIFTTLVPKSRGPNGIALSKSRSPSMYSAQRRLSRYSNTSIWDMTLRDAAPPMKDVDTTEQSTERPQPVSQPAAQRSRTVRRRSSPHPSSLSAESKTDRYQLTRLFSQYIIPNNSSPPSDGVKCGLGKLINSQLSSFSELQECSRARMTWRCSSCLSNNIVRHSRCAFCMAVRLQVFSRKELAFLKQLVHVDPSVRLTSQFLHAQRQASFSHRGPVLFTAPHGLFLVRPRRHTPEKLVNRVATLLSSACGAYSGSLAVWNTHSARPKDPNNLDPNYLHRSDYEHSPWHWALRDHRLHCLQHGLVPFHVDVHGKYGSPESHCDIGMESLNVMWIDQEEVMRLRKSLHTELSRCFAGTRWKFDLDPFLDGYWGDEVRGWKGGGTRRAYRNTTSMQSVQLGMPAIQVELLQPLRQELVSNRALRERFATALCNVYRFCVSSFTSVWRWDEGKYAPDSDALTDLVKDGGGGVERVPRWGSAKSNTSSLQHRLRGSSTGPTPTRRLRRVSSGKRKPHHRNRSAILSKVASKPRKLHSSTSFSSLLAHRQRLVPSLPRDTTTSRVGRSRRGRIPSLRGKRRKQASLSGSMRSTGVRRPYRP